MTREILAFKRGPTVDLSFDHLTVEVRDDRVVLSSGVELLGLWFSWEEWRDFVRRIEIAIDWVQVSTPSDVTGRSFTE